MSSSKTRATDSRQLVLASSSPYRAALLKRLELDFIVVTPDIDEAPLPGEPLADTALRLARLKAQKIAETYPNALIIGCDQVAAFNGKPLGKPGNHENAVKQLQQCRGRLVMFHSALCLLNTATNHKQTRNVATKVRFRDLTDDEIERYLQQEKPYDCAGSAKCEGLGIALISELQSADPTALIGLPLIALTDMLRAEQYPIV